MSLVPLIGVALLAGLGSVAHAHPSSGPLRVALECESGGRTKVCPVFLRGLITRSAALLDSPRSNAQVVLYVAANEVALMDRVHLRFVGEVVGAPDALEIDVELDSRATDDEQIAQLEPAFLRGVALFLAAVHPEAVTIELNEVTAAVLAPAPTTPWSTALAASGFGNWSGEYQSYSGAVSASVSRVTPTRLLRLTAGSNAGLERRPSLAVDGEELSLDSTSWSVFGDVMVERHLDDRWSVAAMSGASRQDPKGQYRYAWRAAAGIEWDRYASDDPRGNVLAVAYALGWDVEAYNFPNDRGERFAQFPTHRLAAAGRIRRDKISYGVGLSIDGEVLHPLRRHSLAGWPSITVKLGDHVDLSLSLSVTQRELPEPQIPDDDYEAISRGSYAEAFSASGSMSISVHWDRTNGAQNNRFQEI